jgi:hypothetical protein
MPIERLRFFLKDFPESCDGFVMELTWILLE